MYGEEQVYFGRVFRDGVCKALGGKKMKINKLMFEELGEACSIHLEPSEFKQFKDFMEKAAPMFSMTSGNSFPFSGFLIRLWHEINK